MGKILVVEDEISIQRILEFELKKSGLDVDTASDGEEGLQLGLSGAYDVILLDVMLPKRDGFEVCKELRLKNINSHIVMLSARDEEFNRVMGLEVGADDYMTKPFSSREVTSKIKAILRRKQMAPSSVPVEEKTSSAQYLTYKNLKLDTNKIEVWAGEARLDFTLKEYELLAFLMKNENKALSRDILLDHLWGVEYFGETRVVDVHIFKIRDKLKPFGVKIKTVRGIGYMLEGEGVV